MIAVQRSNAASAFGPANPLLTGLENVPVAPTHAPPIALLGVPVCNLTMAEAVDRIDRMVASGQPHYVVTPNVDFLVQALQDVELHRILVEADLVLCDGTPLVWASRLLGNPLPERVAGSDLAPLLICLATRRNYRLFLLGASPEANAQAVARLKEQHPALNIVGSYSPPYKPLLEMDHEEIKRRIGAARPDLLFVSFGCPKQEKWIAMHYEALGVPVTIGMGATIDFLAGRVKRAPRWMQGAGLEWVFRLLQEPRRLFKRYAIDFWRFGGAIFAQWARMRSRPGGCRQAPPSFTVAVEPAWQRIQVSERLDVQSVKRDKAVWEQIVADGRHCLLEVTDTQFIDSTGMGWLVWLQNEIRRAGNQLILLAPSLPVRRALELMRLEEFFEMAADVIEAREIIGRRQEEQSTLVLVNGARRPLAWQGEVTAANADEVWRLTERQINRLGACQRRLSIDLSGMRFVDSAGLGVMVRAKKFAAQQGGQLYFTGARSNVRNAVRLSKLESFLLNEPA